MTRLLTLAAGIAALTFACGNQDGSQGSGPIELLFDGESCVYDGPTEIGSGSIELSFVNASDSIASMNFVILDEGYTVQDVIEYMGPQPSQAHHPSWTQEIPGAWRSVGPGEVHEWSSELDPGLYNMVCVRMSPFGVWFGSGLTVDA